MKINVKNTSCNALPEYKTNGAGAMDIAVSESCVISPHKVVLAHTGLFLEIPENFCVYLIARSSLYKHGLMLANSVGVIDSDYRGELMVALYNFTDDEVKVSVGERVAQIMLTPVIPITWCSVDSLSKTERGDGGFGSTSI